MSDLGKQLEAWENGREDRHAAVGALHDIKRLERENGALRTELTIALNEPQSGPARVGEIRGVTACGDGAIREHSERFGFPPRGPHTCICADPENCREWAPGCRAGLNPPQPGGTV